MMNKISKPQAQALATATRLARPDWDHPGIVAAILRCDATYAETGAAIFRLAQNMQMRSPVMLPDLGRHWTADLPSGPATRTYTPCGIHPGQTYPCPTCEAQRPPVAALTTIRAIRAAHPIPTSRPDRRPLTTTEYHAEVQRLRSEQSRQEATT